MSDIYPTVPAATVPVSVIFQIPSTTITCSSVNFIHFWHVHRRRSSRTPVSTGGVGSRRRQWGHRIVLISAVSTWATAGS